MILELLGEWFGSRQSLSIALGISATSAFLLKLALLRASSSGRGSIVARVLVGVICVALSPFAYGWFVLLPVLTAATMSFLDLRSGITDRSEGLARVRLIAAVLDGIIVSFLGLGSLMLLSFGFLSYAENASVGTSYWLVGGIGLVISIWFRFSEGDRSRGSADH